MIAAIHELLTGSLLGLYILVLVYFWFQWCFKLLLCQFYRPYSGCYELPVSVVMPVYNEDRTVLFQALTKVFAQPLHRLAEVIVVCDHREPDLPLWLKTQFAEDDRLTIAVGERPGKRYSLAKGIELSRYEVVVSIESDVMIRDDSLHELIRPFENAAVGGVVGDQEVHQPKRSIWTFLDYICEKIKYTIIYPALSVAGQVTVLSGRTVAYRRKAVVPVLGKLTQETFFGRHCFSGDDGRLTSLLLEHGWRTCYQSTSVVETISPQNIMALLRQRTRWYRNSSRRTLRALFWDRLWVWRGHPLAAWHMVSTWLNTIMVGLAIALLGFSIASGNFLWFGSEPLSVAARCAMLFFGLVLTRSVRGSPAISAIRKINPGRRWLLILALPFYLLLLWLVRLHAIVTMNKQGWITRSQQSPGGL